MDSVDAAHYSSAGASAQQSSYQPPPISNYKGVMLCDRPVNKAAGGKAPQVRRARMRSQLQLRDVLTLASGNVERAADAVQLQHGAAEQAGPHEGAGPEPEQVTTLAVLHVTLFVCMRLE